MLFHHTLHKKFWNYLAQHPGMSKASAAKALYDEHIISDSEALTLVNSYYMCLACDAAEGDCTVCPLQPAYTESHTCLGGVFSLWDKINDSIIVANTCESDVAVLSYVDSISISLDSAKRLASMYARTIMNLPVRDNVDVD